MSDETPNDGNLINFIAATLETMRDQMATKDDLARLEERLTTKLEAEATAIRGDIERIDLRLDANEKTIRIRLIYLFAKDRPEVLRLLG